MLGMTSCISHFALPSCHPPRKPEESFRIRQNDNATIMSLNLINNKQLLLVWFGNITRQPKVQTLLAAHNGLCCGKFARLPRLVVVSLNKLNFIEFPLLKNCNMYDFRHIYLLLRIE